MSNDTYIDVAVVTWPNHPERWRCFQETLASWRKNLTAGPHTVRYVCSSESEPDPKHQWYGDELAALCKQEGIPLQFRDGKPGLGENMNAALRMCKGDYIIVVQDDRPLVKPLAIAPYIQHLAKCPEVSLVRFSWPQGRNPTTYRFRVKVMTHPSGLRRLALSSPWIYGDDPHLRRRSFMAAHGWYIEGVRHGASEGDMIQRLRRQGATIAVADEIYCGHNCADVPAVITDTRPQGANR